MSPIITVIEYGLEIARSDLKKIANNILFLVSE